MKNGYHCHQLWRLKWEAKAGVLYISAGDFSWRWNPASYVDIISAGHFKKKSNRRIRYQFCSVWREREHLYIIDISFGLHVGKGAGIRHQW